MIRRYALDIKIASLNQLDQNDGDLKMTSDLLEIPRKTLERWRAAEDNLRADYRKRQKRHLERLKFDLQAKMLERSQAILEQIDNKTLAKAPLSQLNSALTALLNHALKLEEATQSIDTQPAIPIRFEYYYDGQVQDAPPWAGASHGQPRAVQGGRLREALGQNGTGQKPDSHKSAAAPPTLLVAGANPTNGQ